jgi:sulfide:quinone oxidoreductase
MASSAPVRVVVAGGGVAGLETLMALRSLAGPRVKLTLVAPHDDFVYRPLAVEAPFAVGRTRRVALHDAARDAGATFVSGTIEAVDADRRTVSPSDSHPLEYDALVLAVGAEAVPVVAHALTWDDRSDAETLGGLIQDIEQGYSRRLAIVIPPGPSWPLRAYELALFITRQAKGMSVDLETTIVTPEPSPLAALGSRAMELISHELGQAGVDVVSAADAEIEQGHAATVVMQPAGRRLEVDRVLALPGLRGRPIAGIPADADGFVEVDEHGRVLGLDRVWAAGDGTAFALKSGGFAAEQADVAAQDIAAVAGADVETRSFDPSAREQFAGLPAGPFLKAWLAEGDEEGLTTGLPATDVPTLTYLQRDLEAGWRGPT